jgi:hypothetical protein
MDLKSVFLNGPIK